MSDWNDYPFQYSLPVDPSKLPEGYFHILPSRQSSLEVDTDAIEQMKDEWIHALGNKGTGKSTLDEKILSNILHVYPECPPSKSAPMLKLATIVGLWDDETDSLETAKHQAIVDDIALAIVSKLKTGSSTPCEYKINELYFNTFMQAMELLGVQDHEHNMLLQGFLKMLQSQTVAPLDQMTFEAYKEQRIISCAGLFANLVIPTCHDLKVSESEMASVSSIVKLGSLIAGLVNDFESFPKEFEEHFTADSLEVIHNAMAVLMANYGYTEEEAKNILKEEILSLERKMLDEYDAWKSSPSFKSDDMRRYMALCILGAGGACHVQANSPRYHGIQLSTTAEDRAKLVGRNETNYKLHGYPSPALYKHNAETPSRRTEIVGEGEGDILAPFERAPAEQICMAPYEYTRSMPGKKTIGNFIESIRSWLDLPDHSASVIERVASMLFHSSLMIDDIEDESMLRRGKPAAHLVFGKSQTVNSATYLYARATRELNQLQKPECSKAFLDELETLALGQALDLYWKFQEKCPTTREYFTMIDNKTGGFFRMALRLMEIESNVEPCPDLMYLVTLLGRYYQIRDDYMNLTSDEYTGTKGYCEDLSEGKFSFPLVHALQHSPVADQIRGLLFHRENGGDLSLEMKEYIVSVMRDAGSLSHARDTAMLLFDALMETLERVEAKLGPNKRLKALLLWLKM